MNKTTAAARIGARTIHPLQSNVPAECAAQAAQDHILSVPALREITPADILAAHKAAARAVVLDSPIPSPAECDAQMSELYASDVPVITPAAVYGPLTSVHVSYNPKLRRTEVRYFDGASNVVHRAAFFDGKEIDSMLYSILDWTRDYHGPELEYAARMQ